MKLLTIEELKAVLNISRGTIYRLCEQKMPHYRVGTGYRFDLDEVKKWMSSKEASKKVQPVK